MRRKVGPDTSDFSYRTDPRAHQPGLIVVLPAYHADKVGRSAAAFDQALPSAMRERGRHEVTVIDRTQRDQLFTPAPHALHEVMPDHLRALRDVTGADAVIFTFIDQYQSYDPIFVGMRCYMVSCHDGSTLWTASGHFDSGHKDVQDDIENWYHYERGEANENLTGWRATMSSPSAFARYVTHRLSSSVLW